MTSLAGGFAARRCVASERASSTACWRAGWTPVTRIELATKASRTGASSMPPGHLANTSGNVCVPTG
eukprot:528417-Alexandrium_andersonii.AAC.1